jgi:hypothetical protein
MTSGTVQGWLRRTAVATAAAAMLCAGTAWAQAKETNKDMCRPSQMAQVESKTCPDGQVVRRACCTKTSEKGTKTRCKSFPHCPHRSRS